MLADVCSACATQVDAILERHGGHGRNAIRLKQPDAVSRDGPARKLGGVAVRSIVYLWIALASFLLVTWLTSRG